MIPPRPVRLKVSLGECEAAAVRRLAAASRQSASSIVADIIEDAAPVLERLSVALESAATMTAAARAELLAVLNREAPKAHAAALSAYEGIAAVEKAARTARSRADLPQAGRPASTARIANRNRPTPG